MKPRFYLEAEKRARELGVTVKEILDADAKRLEFMPGPSPDCLDSDDIARLIANGNEPPGWRDEKLNHVEKCADCYALLYVSRAPKPGVSASLPK